MSKGISTPASPRVKAASEVDRIVEQFNQVQDGGAWHGPSIREGLEGLSAADAARRPIGGAHCIWEIVDHIRITEEAVRRDLTGQSPSEEADWPSPTDTSEAAWRKSQDRLRAGQRALRDAISKLPPGRLLEQVTDKPHSYWYELLGLMHHDAYHAGQISLLRKGTGS